MEDSKAAASSKLRKLVLTKDTVRILNGKQAKTVIGGAFNPTSIITPAIRSAATGCCKATGTGR